MAHPDDRFERAQALKAALDPIIDVCLRIGVHSAELESLVRVEFVHRAAQTLPGNLKSGRGPSHEAIGLATGLNRGEVQDILAKGTRSAALRMKRKSEKHSKSERILDIWSKNTRYLSASGLPLDLPLDLRLEGPSFAELVQKALPGKLPKHVLKELRRRGLVQLLPDEIIRYRPRTSRSLPIELSAAALADAAEQMRLLGNTLLQTLSSGNAPPSSKEFGVFVASSPVKIPTDLIQVSQVAMLQRIASFIQGFELEFGKKAKTKDHKTPTETIGVSVYTWRPKL